MIYFDNNATTIMPPEVKASMLEWCNRGNPSAGYASAKEARTMMMNFKKYIGKLCNIDPCCTEERDIQLGERANIQIDKINPAKYKIIFTSGASESNCMVISGIIDSYKSISGRQPHIVISAIEHKSILEQVHAYEAKGCLTATYVNPTASGHINPKDISAAITPSTCLVCVMHANNETGAINNIKEIGKIAHDLNVPFHCDAVQTFGKFPINPIRDNVDSFSISFHKFHGPPGVGALVIKQQLLFGYKISPMIFGTQNEGLRGGTENLPGIGASFTASTISMKNRGSKNTSMENIKKIIIGEISKRIPSRSYVDYMRAQNSKEIEIIFLSGEGKFYLPNTIMLSVVKRSKPLICNGKIKQRLEDKGIVISVGSACNTSNPRASHVLFAMGADELIRKGALRISIGDETTIKEAKIFVKEFILAIANG